MDIFRDEQDYAYMLDLFKRHLSQDVKKDKKGRLIPNYADEVELIAYCLMPNHYHFLFYLKEKTGIEKLMRSMMTAYSRYFNTKYKRVGTLFQNHFLAARITSDRYLWHVSRYMHLNPLDIDAEPLGYAYSSVSYFRGDRSAEWLHEDMLVETAEQRATYIQSLRDSSDYHELMDRLKHELAHV